MSELDLTAATFIRPGTAATLATLRRLGGRIQARGVAVHIEGVEQIPSRWVAYELAGDTVVVFLETESPDLDAGCNVQYDSSKQAE